MSMNKTAKLWFVNVFSCVLFSILTLTGLINWLFVPRGGGGEGGFAVHLRHFLREVHEWTALLFIVMTLIHLALHWTYLKSNLQEIWNNQVRFLWLSLRLDNGTPLLLSE